MRSRLPTPALAACCRGIGDLPVGAAERPPFSSVAAHGTPCPAHPLAHPVDTECTLLADCGAFTFTGPESCASAETPWLFNATLQTGEPGCCYLKVLLCSPPLCCGLSELETGGCSPPMPQMRCQAVALRLCAPVTDARLIYCVQFSEGYEKVSGQTGMTSGVMPTTATRVRDAKCDLLPETDTSGADLTFDRELPAVLASARQLGQVYMR